MQLSQYGGEKTGRSHVTTYHLEAVYCSSLNTILNWSQCVLVSLYGDTEGFHSAKNLHDLNVFSGTIFMTFVYAKYSEEKRVGSTEIRNIPRILEYQYFIPGRQTVK